MRTTNQDLPAPRRRVAAGAMSAGVLILAAGVVYGWQTGSGILIRGGLAGTPLQYNTALGAVLASIALILATIGLDRPVRALGFILSIGAGLTLFQYLTNVDVGIDRIALDPWHVARRAYPGRMAPQTAICLTSIGVGLVCLRRAPLVASTLSIVVLVLGALTLAGYMMEVRPAFAWGGATPMALATAVLLIALGGSLALLASPGLAADRPGGPWIAYIAGAATLLGTVSFAGAISQQRDVLVDRVIVETMAGLGREVRTQIRRHAAGLYHLDTRLPTLDEGFRADRATTKLLMRTPAGPAALEWIDLDLRTRRRVRSKVTPDAAAIRNLGPAERAAFRAHGERQGPFTAPPQMLDSGRTYFRIALSIGRPDRHAGFVAAVVFLDDFLLPVLGAEQPLYDVTITNGDTAIFHSGSDSELAARRLTSDLKLPGDNIWMVTMAPSREFEVIFGNGLAAFVLTAGIVLAVLATSTIRGWQNVDFQRRTLLVTNETLREEVERHRQEAQARISAEDRLRIVHSTTPVLAATTVRSRRRHLEEDLSRFASFVSHELRQPLASMRIFVKLLETKVDMRDETTREYIDELRSNVDRMVAAIEGQLTLVRSVTSDEDEAYDTVIDLNVVLEDVHDTMRDQLDTIGGTLTVAPLARVEGNQPQVEQVFRNLIENAVKYRDPERPLVVTIDGHPTDHDMYAVRIADNGTGFDPGQAKTLFTMFHRLDPARSPGSGIGLALCRRIVERHGGAIAAEGRPGEGSTFYLTLPLAPSAPDATNSA